MKAIIYLFPFAGFLQFEASRYGITETDGNVEIVVLRQHGSDGKVGVMWRAVRNTAGRGTDYTASPNEIPFQNGEVREEVSKQK